MPGCPRTRTLLYFRWLLILQGGAIGAPAAPAAALYLPCSPAFCRCAIHAVCCPRRRQRQQPPMIAMCMPAPAAALLRCHRRPAAVPHLPVAAAAARAARPCTTAWCGSCRSGYGRRGACCVRHGQVTGVWMAALQLSSHNCGYRTGRQSPSIERYAQRVCACSLAARGKLHGAEATWGAQKHMREERGRWHALLGVFSSTCLCVQGGGSGRGGTRRTRRRSTPHANRAGGGMCFSLLQLKA